jgi:flagellar biosynthesis protein FlhB
MAEEQADTQDRTEEPTEKRRKEFREKGMIPVSRDINSVLSLLVMLPVVALGIGDAMAVIGDVLRTPLDLAADPGGSIETLFVWAPDLMARVVWTLAPMMVVLMATALLTGVVQTRGNLSFKALEPKFDKLNPFEGIKRLVSWQAATELFKSLLKLSAVLLGAYVVFRMDYGRLLALDRADLDRGVVVLGETALRLCAAAAIALLAPAAVDYGLQVYRMNKRQRMTRDEVKRDLKDQEGDPMMKNRRRRLAQSLSANRMIHNVTEADVIINNPSHLSVALRYVHGVTEVPEVVAKGADHMAIRLRAEARRHGIPQIQNRGLARTLYQHCDVGDPIPPDLFEPVAGILGFVHRIRGLRGMDETEAAPSTR